MIASLLFYTFVAIVGIQLLFFLGIFRSFVYHKEKKTDYSNTPSVSVIICAKNEEENLKKNIPAILGQDYPRFELVLINDVSSDNTLEVMEYFSSKDSRVKVVDVKNNETFWGNKKYALTLGIKSATYDYLLFTDADCEVQSSYWIKEMVKKLDENITIILGYGPYRTVKKSFLNALIRFETLITAIQYFSYAKIGIPYMGVGRNLAYKKNEFFEVKGFIKHMNLKSGDDDLFIKEVATKKNTAFNYSKDSLTISDAKTTFSGWFNQKRRHVSTATHYKIHHKFLLGSFYLSQFFFWGLLICLLILGVQPIAVATLTLLRFITQLIIYRKGFKKLHENKLHFYLPFLEVFLILFQFTIFIVNSFSKPPHWK